MKKAKITFFMLAYNAEKTVKKAVLSILNQSEKDINLLVRNNGSTDKTGEILSELAKNDERLHVFYNKINWCDASGKSYTADGIIRIWPIENKNLLGEYISIVDSDDWLDPDFAKKMYEAAKEADADMTVCGNDFINKDGESTGVRLPPEINAKSKEEFDLAINKSYPQLHNSLRTWWGKLFETEYFLKNYDEAWLTVGGGYGNVLDTAIMLRYLEKAERLVTVPETLYKFRMSETSTYNTRRMVNYWRTLEADTLYTTALNCIKHFNAVNTTNLQWIMQIHWSYINETLECLNTKHDDFTAKEELSGIASIMNSSVMASYYPNNINAIFPVILKYIKLVFERNNKNPQLYTSYLTRLLFLCEKLDAGEANLIFFPILIGCLYDSENNKKVGLHLLEKVIPPDMKEKFPSLMAYLSSEMCACVSTPVFLSDYAQRRIVTAPLEKELQKAFEAGDMDKSGILIEKINNADPINKTAIYYLMKMIWISGKNRDICAVLAATLISLFPSDSETKPLCWSILAENQGGISDGN